MCRCLKYLATAMLLSALACAGAVAQEPVCNAESAGVVACIAGRQCECRFARGSPATGLPDGHRWDCGILRPGCGAPPATIDGWQGQLPSAVLIDNSSSFRDSRLPDRGHLPPR